MELREALSQITAIRLHIAQTETYRGYRSIPAAFSGALAVGAAALQSQIVPYPLQDLEGYLALWITMAGLTVLVAVLEMSVRSRYSQPLAREKTWVAAGLLAPSLVAGALVTAVIATVARDSAWILPGLWQVFFSLGLFASCRLLPREIFLVAVFYLITGLSCISSQAQSATLSPWLMGAPFGVGQLMAAAILYWRLERGETGEGRSA